MKRFLETRRVGRALALLTASLALGASSVARAGAPALWDQSDHPGGQNIPSQNFESIYDAYDSQAADDFAVPTGQFWYVDRVEIMGTYIGTGPAASVNVWFYADKAGLPKKMIYEQREIPVALDVAGDLYVDLPVGAVLPAGTYWLSFQVNMSFASSGYWYWSARSMQTGSAFAWRNPGDGYGTGCTEWTTGSGCAAVSDPDLLFVLRGGVSDDSACNSPAMTFDDGAATVPPDGWSVVDTITPGVSWTSSATFPCPNYTGGSGVAATASSDDYGVGAFDTELRSPAFGMVGETAAEVRFLLNYQNYAGYDHFAFDISTDNFATWTTLMDLNEDHGGLFGLPGTTAVVDLSPYAGQTGLQARWRYWDHRSDAFDWYVQIDDIELRCGLFFDGFESADASRWSSSAP